MICLKKQQKIEEANGMHNLPIVPTQVTLRGNVGSLAAPIAAQLFTFGHRGQGNALRGSRMVSKISQKEQKPILCPICQLCPHR